MKIKVIFPLIFFLLLSSCSFLQKMDVGQKAILLKSVTRIGTILSLNELQNEEIANMTSGAIRDTIMPILENENVIIDLTNMGMLFDKIPIEIRPFLNDAMQILSSYGVGTEPILSKDSIVYLKAFFQGVYEGCQAFLNVVEEDHAMVARSNQSFEFVYQQE